MEGQGRKSKLFGLGASLLHSSAPCVAISGIWFVVKNITLVLCLVKSISVLISFVSIYVLILFSVQLNNEK